MTTLASNPDTQVPATSREASLFGSPGRLLALLVLAGAVALAALTSVLSVTVDGGAWLEAAAAAGMVATVASAAVMLGSAQGWANGRQASLAAVATAVVGLGALALVAVTYIGGVSDAGVSGGAAVTNDVSAEGAALSQQVSNNEIQPPGYAHDTGVQPTIGEFETLDNATILRSVPGGTVLPNEVDVLRSELSEARGFALQFDTVEKARAAGYYNTTNDVPFMGAHFLNQEYLTDGVFDPSRPEGLLFSKLGDADGDWQLVGVWYLLLPGQGGATVESPPEGFTGGLDLWHSHYGLCTRAGVISENNTAAGCAADNGNFIGDLRWMMHAWVYPEAGVDNSEGVFVYLNSDLWEVQAQADAPILAD